MCLCFLRAYALERWEAGTLPLPVLVFLAKQSGAMVLPVALRGLGEMKKPEIVRWFRCREDRSARGPAAAPVTDRIRSRYRSTPTR